MESVSGKAPMVEFWLHTGFLNVSGEKMSKSLNNFITIRELLEEVEPDTFRFFVLSTHYRSPIDFSKDNLHQAEATLNRIRNYYARVAEKATGNNGESEFLNQYSDKFYTAMDDDFHTPRAIKSIFNLINATNFDELSENDFTAIKNFLDTVSDIFGISFVIEEDNGSSDELLELIGDIRTQLRSEKQYDLSDKIRDNLNELGYEVND